MSAFILILIASLLIAIGIVWSIGPVRLLVGLTASLIAVPLVWLAVASAVLAAWLMHAF